MITYTTNKTLKAEAVTNTGSPNITIVNHTWKINNITIPTNEDNVTINTSSDLNLGQNTLSLTVLNSCGKWSQEYSDIINIINKPIPDVIYMEQVFNVTIDKELTEIEVTLQLTGIVKVKVTTPLGKVVQNATVKINEITAITDEFGIATLENIPYGNITGIVIY